MSSKRPAEVESIINGKFKCYDLEKSFLQIHLESSIQVLSYTQTHTHTHKLRHGHTWREVKFHQTSEKFQLEFLTRCRHRHLKTSEKKGLSAEACCRLSAFIIIFKGNILGLAAAEICRCIYFFC